jgi:predicted nuclease with RNAse H fold
MSPTRGPWAGVDVGGLSKGFDIAVVGDDALLHLERRCKGPAAVIEAIRPFRPTVVAVDSPRSAAPPGATHRAGELRLRDAVCGIRWTPDQEKLDAGNPYYEWINCGLELYGLLAKSGEWEVIEVFPTASWTRWFGPRDGTRAAWTRSGLVELGLSGAAGRTSQDARDAIAAAVTARQHPHATEEFGEIVAPRPGPPTPQ